MKQKDIITECRKWRRMNDITQEQIAKELDLSVGTISLFENGKNKNADILMWYLSHMGFKLEDLNNG